MTKKLVKILSVVLSALIIFSIAVPAFAAETTKNVPIVFIGGRGTKLLDKDGKQIYPVTYDRKAYIAEKAKTIVPLLMKAMATNDYKEYGDALYNAVAPLYDDMRLDKNGNVQNGSHTFFTWSKQTLKWRVRADNDPYRIYDFSFYYDWRLDLNDIADDFKRYVDDVCEVTGSKKVRIIGRCMGGNIVSAYLTKYGAEKVEKVLFYATTANGAVFSGAPFSGQLDVEGDGLSRYLSDYLGDDVLDELIRSTVNLMNVTGGLTVPVGMIKNIYKHIQNDVVPRLVLTSYGSYPSYWEMVDPVHYEDAKKFAFSGREAEYNEFIKKIDTYHYGVMRPLYGTLKSLEAQGLKIYVVAKYGKQMVPILQDNEIIGDDCVELTGSSFGATVSSCTGTLTKAYLKGQNEKGLGKYISPDKQVDASTCLFPDRTWFVKNCSHNDFHKAINDMMVDILRYNGHMTVNDDPRYTQYMMQKDKPEKIIFPMTEENCNGPHKWNPNIFEAVRNFFLALFRYVINYIENGFTSK